MKKIRKLLEVFIHDEGGDSTVVIMVFSLMFITLSALVLNLGLWNQKRQNLQMIADSAARAGTLGYVEDDRHVIQESNGKYHVYTELTPSLANGNAQKVIDAAVTDGFEIEILDFCPDRIYDKTQKVSYPNSLKWSSDKHGYYETYLTKSRQYFNGDFAVFLRGTIHGVWEDLLGLGTDIDLYIYSQAQASGNGSTK